MKEVFMIAVAVVEDEINEQQKTKAFFDNYTKENPNEKFSVVFYKDGETFLKNFANGKFDLVLMDVDLKSKLNGIEVAEKMREMDKEVFLIFMTNLAQYAIEGYKVQAYDYIVKPFTYYDFKLRINQISNLIISRKIEKVILKTDGIKVVVYVKEIYYVEINNHQLIYHTKKGNFQTYGSLKEIEKSLTGFNFSPCNSCYLVNLDYVDEIDGFTAVVHGDKLLISHPKRKQFLKDLTLYLGK